MIIAYLNAMFLFSQVTFLPDADSETDTQHNAETQFVLLFIKFSVLYIAK